MSNTLNTTTGQTLATIVMKLVGFMNLIVPVLASAAIVFFFYGLYRFIRNSGDAKGRAVGRDAIIWGLVGLFVIFSLWGLVRFIQAAFQLPSSSATNQQGFSKQGSSPYPDNPGNFDLRGGTAYPTSGSSFPIEGGAIY